MTSAGLGTTRGRLTNWNLTLADNSARFANRWAEISHREELLTPADLMLLEEIADTAAAVGLFKLGDDILQSVANEYWRRNILFEAHFASLKQIHLRQQCGSFPRSIHELFKDPRIQSASIEDLIPSSSGFRAWERQFVPFLATEERLFLLSNLYLLVGHLLRQLVQLNAAGAVLLEGMRHAREQQTFDSQSVLSSLQLSWMELQLEKGDFIAFDQALGDCEQQLPSIGHSILFQGLKARRALMQGDLVSAQQILSEILDIYISESLGLPARKACLNLAQVFIMMNNIGHARRLIAAALNDCPDEMLEVRSLASSLLEVVQSRSGLVRGSPVIELQTGRQKGKNRPSDEQPLEVQLNDLSFNSFQTLVMRFYAAAGAGRNDAAERLYKTALFFPEGESRLIQVRIGVMSGVREFYQGRYAAAAAIFRTRDVDLAQLRLKPERYENLVLRKRCLDKLAETAALEQKPQLLEESSRVARQGEELLEELSASMPAIDKVTFLLNKATQREEALARSIDVLRNERDGLRMKPKITRIWKRTGLWRKLNHLLVRIYYERESLVLAKLKHDKSNGTGVQVSLLQRVLFQSFDEANLAFLVLPDSVMLIWWSWMQLDFKVASIGREEVRGLVAQWHEATIASRPDIAGRAAEQLCQAFQIAKVLETFPHRIRRLRILADDALHGFPFAALRYQGKYLVEQYIISLTFRPSKRPIEKEATSPCLLVGITEGKLPLPQTKEQIKWLSSEFASRRVRLGVLLDREATPSRFTQELTEARLLHLSCHGNFSLEQPKETGIELFNEDGTTGTFGLDQLVSLDLSRLHHVTLLSCWAADNYVIPGGWVISLPEVLWHAGASSVIGNLWQISEECADAFTRKFYLAAMKFRTDEALREAQLALMRDQRFAEPFDWAGFQIYGEPVPLRF